MKITLLVLLLISIFKINDAELLSKDECETRENNSAKSEILELPDYADPPSAWPVKAHQKITSGYGMRLHPVEKKDKFHFGIDIAAPSGTPVLATEKGEIVEASFTKNYGNYIVIKHDEIYTSKYSQLSKINVKVGDIIEKGYEIGKVGSTGRSNGPHLHFEIKKGGKYVDPEQFIKA